MSKSITISFKSDVLNITTSKGTFELTRAQALTLASAVQIKYRGEDGTN